MSSYLKDLSVGQYPEFNKEIVTGFGRNESRTFFDNLKSYFIEKLKDGPEELKVISFDKLLPDDAFKSTLNDDGVLKTDISHTGFIYINVVLSWEGKKLPARQLTYFANYENKGIPYSGKFYTMVPVFADSVLTMTNDGIMAKLASDKMNFKMKQYSYILNGTIKSEHLFYSDEIVRRSGTKNNLGATYTPMLLFIVARLGVKGAYRLLTGTDDIIISVTKLDKDDDWLHLEPRDRPPSKIYDPLWCKPDLHIYVKADSLNPNGLDLAKSMLYILSVFDTSAEEVIDDLDTPKEISTMETIIARLIYRDVVSPGQAQELLRTKLAMLDTHINDKIVTLLKAIGYEVKGFNDLLVIINEKFIDIITHKGGEVGNTEFLDRYFELFHYIHYPIISSISMFMFDLNKKMMKVRKPTYLEIRSLVNRHIRPTLMFQIMGKRGTSLALEILNQPNQHNFITTTSKMVLQEQGKGYFKGGTKFPVKVRSIRALFMAIGNYATMPKHSPMALATLNPFLRLTKAKRVKLNPQLKKIINSLEKKFSRRIEHNEDE